MLNFKLATIFISLAEMSKSMESSTGTVIDFTRVARTIRDYTGDIAQAYFTGILDRLPGITPQAHILIKEYFETGKIKIYEDLKELYSEDLINFVRMSGLGKRRVFKIYDILGLKNITDLKEAIENRSIVARVLNSPEVESGFITAGHIERLIFSFNYFEKTRGMYPKGYVDFFIERIFGSISSFKGVEKVQITGSLRRKKPFINDIDLLVLPDFNRERYDVLKSELLCREFVNLDFIKQLVGINNRDETVNGQPGPFCSARYTTVYGIDIEIIISSAKSWAFDLFSTTGSKPHVAAVMALAKKRGLDISGFKTQGPGSDDSDSVIYEKLGIGHIEPELREDNGEVELARKFLLPRLIEYSDIKGDMHVHSFWSDGLIEMEDLLRKCKKYNYEYLAITDHSSSNKYGNGLDEKRMLEKLRYFNDFKKQIREVRLLVGGEVDIRSAEKLDYEDDMLRRIDFVLASMHSNYLNSRAENTRRFVNAIKNRFVDAVAHPTGVVFGARAPYDLEMEQILESAAACDKALEINSYLLRLDLCEE
ncbi:MAG: hypothetical protein FJW66_04020, partial [Actinobacteria bacterium]|nr:hypothetical protein [Actinomycetota bacterium]